MRGRLCPQCGQMRPSSNFPMGSDICYRHIPHLKRLGHLRALAEIRGEPIPKAKKTREELDRAARRRHREKEKIAIALGAYDRHRLIHRGNKTPIDPAFYEELRMRLDPEEKIIKKSEIMPRDDS